MFGRETVENPIELGELCSFFGVEPFIGKELECCVGSGSPEAELGFQLAASKDIVCAVHGDSRQPAAEGSMIGETIELSKGGDERIMDDVLSVVGRSEESRDDICDRAGMATNQGRLGLFIAIENSTDEVGVTNPMNRGTLWPFHRERDDVGC